MYVDDWTNQKNLLHKEKLQTSLEIPNFQFACRPKIQSDLFPTAATVLEN